MLAAGALACTVIVLGEAVTGMSHIVLNVIMGDVTLYAVHTSAPLKSNRILTYLAFTFE